ncbi:hypothetical protein ACFLSQ_10990, partial [Bacteroidota bacterium]
WYHFSGKQYQVWMFSDSTVMKENIVKFFESILLQVAWIGIIPLLIGIAVSFMKSKTLFFGIIILILTCIAYAVNYSIHDIESYFVTAFAGLMLFIGIGLWKFAKMVPNLAYALLALPVISLALNYNYNDRSDDYLVPEYTKILFQKLEPNAMILSSQWDFWVSAAWYMQRIDGFRTDVVIIDKELLRRTWYLDQIKRWYPERIKSCEEAINDYLVDLELFESGRDYSPVSIQSKFISLLNCFVDENYEEYPCYLTLDVIETEQEAFTGYTKIADGLAFRLSKDNIPRHVTTDDIDIRKFTESLQANEGYLVDAIRAGTAISFVNVGRYALMNGDKKEARRTFEKGYKIDPANRFVIDAINNFNNTRFE